MKRYKPDEKDLKIVRVLKANSREAIREIAKKTGLKPSTVHQRMEKLKRDGVIEKYTLKLDNESMDENFIVFMYLATENDLPPEVFKNPHIKEAFGITGEYDLLLKLKFKDIKEFNEFIIDFRKKYEIKKTLTNIATINLKEEV
ncbi:MAG: Lrp/AsnC family transcriptional regulator [archaeon]